MLRTSADIQTWLQIPQKMKPGKRCAQNKTWLLQSQLFNTTTAQCNQIRFWAVTYAAINRRLWDMKNLQGPGVDGGGGGGGGVRDEQIEKKNYTKKKHKVNKLCYGSL